MTKTTRSEYKNDIRELTRQNRDKRGFKTIFLLSRSFLTDSKLFENFF